MGFLPFAVSVPVGKSGEYSVSKLARVAYDPASLFFVNGSYAPFWRTQPPLSEMLCVDTMSEEEAAALELPELAEHIRLTRGRLLHTASRRSRRQLRGGEGCLSQPVKAGPPGRRRPERCCPGSGDEPRCGYAFGPRPEAAV